MQAEANFDFRDLRLF